MTAYEAMLKSKEDAASIITSFCVAVLDGIAENKVPEALRIKIAMLASTVMDSEVEEVKAYES
nr:MAG TPA: hypothetical protein [Caudoviricetes sp.]